MKEKFLLFVAALLATFLTISGIPSLYAQEDNTDEFMLEEVTVTAAKRSENQQKVAITMEVLSSEELKMSGKNDLD